MAPDPATPQDALTHATEAMVQAGAAVSAAASEAEAERATAASNALLSEPSEFPAGMPTMDQLAGQVEE